MLWAKNSIEELFHYRRVNELLFIVLAANEARKVAKKNTIKTAHNEPVAAMRVILERQPSHDRLAPVDKKNDNK